MEDHGLQVTPSYGSRMTVYVATVSYFDHDYHEHLVFDVIDDTVITGPDSPKVLLVRELDGFRRSRSIGQQLNNRDDSLLCVLR